MDQINSEQPDLKLPSIGYESVPGSELVQSPSVYDPELIKNSTANSTQMQVQPTEALPSSPAQGSAQNQPLQTDNSSQPPTLLTDSEPATLKGEDALDSGWIDRIKSIVNSTRQDPRAQTREINRLKAEFLKTRYGKEIKVLNE